MNAPVESAMCSVAAPHTSPRSSVRTLSFSPMVNSSSVTPSEETVSSAGIDSYPSALRAKPAARKPTSGGSRSATAPRPPTNGAMM